MLFTESRFFNTTRSTVLFAFGAMGIAFAALIGWIFGIPGLLSFNYDWRSMIATSSAVILFAGTALLLRTKNKKSLSRLLAYIVSAVGILSLIEYAFSWQSPIGKLLFIDSYAYERFLSSGISVTASIAFLFFGSSLLMFTSTRKWVKYLADFLCIIIFIGALVTLIGHIYNAKELYSVPGFSKASFVTSLCLFLLSMAFLFARPEIGFLSVFYQNSKAAQVGGWQTIFTVFTFFIVGGLSLLGRRAGYYNLNFGISIMIFSFIIIFLLMYRIGIAKLNKAEFERESLYKLSRANEKFVQAILSSLHSSLAVIDKNGAIIMVNQAWEIFANTNAATGPDKTTKGMNYMDICKKSADEGNEIAAQLWAGINSVLKDDTQFFELKYPCHLPDRTQWRLFRAMKFVNDNTMAVIYHDDITELVDAKLKLEESYQSIRRLSDHLQNIREEERTSIAREIHDELGQQLSVIKMDMSWLQDKVDYRNEAVRQKMHNLFTLLNKAINTVQRISRELRPGMLDDLGLLDAIETHLEEFSKSSGIDTFFSGPEKEPALNRNIKTGLFRIVQESLTNAGRHSGADMLNVIVEIKDNNIILTISDNGKGYDENEAALKKTLGILGMKERAAIMGGNYCIRGEKNGGTTIQVTVPLKEPG